MALLIRDLPDDERPREKLTNQGPGALSDAEILALFFGTGTRGKSAVDLGRDIIRQFGSLREMSRASAKELAAIHGIGPAKASQLTAVFEFGRRLAREPFQEQAITTPEDAYDLLAPEMQALSQEVVKAILLNHRKRLIKVMEFFKGTSNESIANPAEILRGALSYAATGLILAHNHPSGDPSPSNADKQVTQRMKAACQAVGIELLDHVIIGCASTQRPSPYFSFREAGLL